MPSNPDPEVVAASNLKLITNLLTLFKVRNERNKAREESKQLRASLEQSLKESNSYKREKNELEQQIQQLKKEMEKIHNCLMDHAGQFNKTG